MKTYIKVFIDVFSKWQYLSIALALAFLIFVFVALLPNAPLLGEVFLRGNISSSEKMAILLHLMSGVYLNDSRPAFIIVCATALFAGLNGALITYVFKKRISGWGRGTGLGVIGILASLLGIGCAACGSLIIAGVAYVGALTPLVLSLPYEGNELEAFGFALMVASLYALLRQAARPLVC